MSRLLRSWLMAMLKSDYGAIQNRDPEDRADSITIGLASSILSNRISHFLNVDGPRYVISSSSSRI